MQPNNQTPPAGVGFFHKTLPHNDQTGLVDPAAFARFQKICQHGGDFADVPQSVGASRLINPRAGWADDTHLGPSPSQMSMPEPPSALSDGTAAEMTELFWMALLRDKPFDEFKAGDGDIDAAIQDLQKAYVRGAQTVIPDVDVPATLTVQNLFRAGLIGEDKGPLVSQFFLQDIAYGTQIILQKQFPYKAHRDYLEDWKSWRDAQNTGKDSDGNDYPDDNPFSEAKDFEPQDFHTEAGLRRINTMRDLARFVNKDALHQAYFNAALLLSNWGAPAGPGNPYGKWIKNQRPFGTLGGPHLLAQVSEVAARALRVVWHQKWGVYLRQRPEAYGGLMDVQARKLADIGLPEWVFQTEAAQRIFAKLTESGAPKNNYLLPMAFTAGSPAHPAYGAGHATVAGACVTILKAWFDGSAKLSEIVKNKGAYNPITGEQIGLVQPGNGGIDPLPPYVEDGLPAEDHLTVGGELNKLAANVALGRSMGGVHWRTDNTRSLRLGEKIATIILRRESMDYDEFPFWQYTNFDGNTVTVRPDGVVQVSGDSELEDFYNQEEFQP
jgi:hypothetical protein